MKIREGMMGIRGGGGGGGGWGDGKGPEWGGAGVGWSGWGKSIKFIEKPTEIIYEAKKPLKISSF